MITFNNANFILGSSAERTLNVSLKINADDFVALIGVNGAGKTTLLDAIAGVRQPNAGVIDVSPPKRPTAYSIQDSANSLLPWLSVLDNILLPGVVSGADCIAIREHAEHLLSCFGLAKRCNDFPYRLSEGEKQIVNIIRCVCTPAEVILLDEPFSALSAYAKKVARTILTEFSRGRTVVLVTHDSTDCTAMPVTRFFRVIETSVIEVSVHHALAFLSDIEAHGFSF